MYDDMKVERDIMVPMRDGIKLACDVYRPAAAGQIVPGAFPVILGTALIAASFRRYQFPICIVGPPSARNGA